MRIQNRTVLALGCAMALLSGTAVGGTTLYGTNVDYSIDSPLGLFGTASLVGDSLVFSPTPIGLTGKTEFLADSSSLFATQTVNITVTAHSGYQLSGFDLSEFGAYTLDGGSAWIGGDFKAIDIEGNTGNQLTAAIIGSALVGNAGAWDAAASIALPASGWGGSDGLVSSVTLTLSNQLFALGAAEIWKNGATIATVTTPVPEADTYLMLLAGLGLIGFLTGRRRLS